MTTAKPTITVLMPVYNAAQYISDAISSVLQQSFIDFELLIINDGSTDETKNIITGFSDARITLINQPNLGVAAALNNGLQTATADLIARFDADDICMPLRLQIQYDFLSQHPEYMIVGSDVDYLDMNNDFVFSFCSPMYNNEQIQQQQFVTCPFIHSSVLFRKDAVLKAGGYNVHAHTFEDHLLWPKILSQGKACNLPDKLLKVRLNPGSVTIDERWRNKRFHSIKKQAILSGDINEKDGTELMNILKEQDTQKIKEGSYYALLSKKYLWNNYQPEKARLNIKKTLQVHPTDINSYGLWLLSYMPDKFIQMIYNWRRNR
ncbi:MAG TPA: glycosyltransferase [Ferruginibacter sp.]|nr:glycosyltransferase [Ferruginibacter sp.]